MPIAVNTYTKNAAGEFLNPIFTTDDAMKANKNAKAAPIAYCVADGNALQKRLQLLGKEMIIQQVFVIYVKHSRIYHNVLQDLIYRDLYPCPNHFYVHYMLKEFIHWGLLPNSF